MKLTKIKITSFKNIKKLELDFSKKNFKNKIIIGKNNLGKNNILKAIELLNCFHDNTFVLTDEEIKDFNDISKNADSPLEIKYFFNFEKNDFDNVDYEDEKIKSISLSKIDYELILTLTKENEKLKKTYHINPPYPLLNEIFEKFKIEILKKIPIIYYNYYFNKSIIKLKHNIKNENDVFSKIILKLNKNQDFNFSDMSPWEIEDFFKEISEKLTNFLFDEKNLTIKIYPANIYENEILVYFKDKRKKIKIKPDHISDGLACSINFKLLSLLQKTNSIFEFREPSNYLHIDLQTRILNFFETTKNQIIFTTHSPFMLGYNNMFIFHKKNGFWLEKTENEIGLETIIEKVNPILKNKSNQIKLLNIFIADFLKTKNKLNEIKIALNNKEYSFVVNECINLFNGFFEKLFEKFNIDDSKKQLSIDEKFNKLSTIFVETKLLNINKYFFNYFESFIKLLLFDIKEITNINDSFYAHLLLNNSICFMNAIFDNFKKIFDKELNSIINK